MKSATYEIGISRREEKTKSFLQIDRQAQQICLVKVQDFEYIRFRVLLVDPFRHLWWLAHRMQN